MKNTVKNTIYSATGLALLGLNSAHAAINFQGQAINGDLKGSEKSADAAIQSLIGNFMTFLAIIAVAFALWGGFNILTAGGDEDKVKKGKTVLIQASAGLLVIFLANSIVQWVLSLILTSA